jgi:hypothetical protein
MLTFYENGKSKRLSYIIFCDHRSSQADAEGASAGVRFHRPDWGGRRP